MKKGGKPKHILLSNDSVPLMDLQLLHYRSIVKYADDAILSKTLDGIITTWNDGAEKMYGYKRAEVIGKSISIIFPPERSDELSHIMSELRKGNTIDHYETVRITKDGRPLDVAITISPIKNEKGVIIGASTIARDITEQKKIMNRLIDSERQFRELTESIPQIIWTTDSYGTNTFFNTQWYEYTGFTPDHFSLNGFVEALHPDDKDIMVKKWIESMRTSNEFICEFRLRRHDGEYKWFLGMARPIHDQKDNVVKWFGSMTDIDERKQIEKTKEEFLGIASHELKTPLTTLKAFTQILQKHFKKQEDLKAVSYLGKMDNQINKLTKLVYDLLDISKITAGKLQLNKEAFNFNELLDETIEAMRETSDHHKIIKKGEINRWVFADKYRIEQVLENLISNAIKYSPDSDKVLISLKSGKDDITVSVHDYGIGISKDQVKRIFDRFYRVEDVQHASFPGLGLGLYISEQIVVRHGGVMSVKSTEGKGSIFSFTLPITLHNELVKKQE